MYSKVIAMEVKVVFCFFFPPNFFGSSNSFYLLDIQYLDLWEKVYHGVREYL